VQLDIVVQRLNDFPIEGAVVLLGQLFERIAHLFGVAYGDCSDVLFHAIILQPIWLHVKRFPPPPVPNDERAL
jgi:hypothetical protein